MQFVWEERKKVQIISFAVKKNRVWISLDKKVGKVKSFVKKGKITYPILMGNKEVTNMFGGVQSIPTTIVIDRNMKIVDQHVGFAPESAFKEKIEKLLNAK